MSIKTTIKHIIGMGAPLIRVRSKMPHTVAENLLAEYSPDPNTTCVAHNKIDEKYDLHIIVACYNVEDFIVECLNSIMNQDTKYSYIVTAVNDGSTDRTGEILNKYSNDYPDKLEVITQENKGFSGARNSALRRIKGRYVTFVDSDDVLMPNAVESLMNHAEDITQGSYYNFRVGSKGDVKRQVVLATQLSGFPWGKIFKAEVLEKFKFPEGYWFEDTPISCIMYGMGYRMNTIQDIVYGYRLNPNGISATAGHSKRSIESWYITKKCYEEYPDFGVDYDQRAYDYLLNQCVMNEKRTQHQPKKIREAIFTLECELMMKYFANFSTQDSNLRRIESALKKKEFVSFELLVRAE
ncbi:putative glycosyltransferase EpsJ [Lactobacillus helveticus]|uniref:glycosyltransferase family 2 protein n=2 Tax=Lactobacillus helveticus TaxID=1587 RepID=UPI001562DE1E|nr:glycosyltransferase family A protein [Lactobacillus helveticus]NRO57296.1 putative glycosyltransferase EpsJ [Lactobacillus helveticus]NRO73138.1 putative glycosyltransferase EpsJ [Lactobacillus helveticus]